MEEYIGFISNENERCINESEQIVRCHDCEHYRPELYKNISCEWFMSDVTPNGFCKWGKKRKKDAD